MELPKARQSLCKKCSHYNTDHDLKGDKLCKKEGCICPGYTYDITADLSMLGVTAGLSSLLLGGMSKMFGMGNEGDIKAKDVLYVFIDGFMGYYNEKLEEINALKDKQIKTEEELERYKQMYEEMKALADKNMAIAKEWQSKHMKMVSKARVDEIYPKPAKKKK